MIEIKNISKSFGPKQALNNLSFSVREGSAFGLLGRNGAGKTTCIRIIMGIFPQDTGEVLINGAAAAKAKVTIGYLPEERGLYPKRTIHDQMVYIGELRGLTAADAKKRAGLLLEQLEASEYLNKKLDTLSKGNQQKIQLGIALINDPDIVILDEPFSGLDPVNASILKSVVGKLVKEGRTVIFSSHQMSQVEEFCDDICLINNGEGVLEGNLNKIKKSYARNKIYVEPEASFRDVLPELLNEKINAAHIISKGSGYLITLKHPEQKGQLLTTLQELNVPLETFSVSEPTLEEIFIEKVG